MTDGLYQFRQPEAGRINIVVFDASTGSERDLKTLSGGETFLASLALALGFSEVVEEENGGIRLDTIFIDEGFGSLDPDYLDRSINVLTRLTNERRVILISHVEQLKDRIEQQIIIQKSGEGSNLSIKSSN